MTPDETFLTLKEAADILRVSRLTVYRYVTSKQLPAYKLGRDYRIRRTEFDAFLEDRRTMKRKAGAK